jgi:DNA-binding SARP family transcriptional activator
MDRILDEMTSALTMYLTTLGDLEVRVVGPAGERSLSKGKPAALLTYLACSPGRRATRERVASLLWADGSSDSARQNLRQTLWYIKRRLGELVETSDDVLALAADTRFDRDDFLALAASGDHAAAIGRYAGSFLPEFAAPGAEGFEEWAEVERRRLSAAFVACAELEVRAALAQGRFADAVRLARRARDESPAELAGWRLLFEALVAARDQVGITAELAQFDLLIEHEDLAPDPATRATVQLARRVLRGETPSGDAPASETSQVLAPDLVGREVEFRRMIDAWDAAGRGRGSMLLLAGAAGLGKSRLLNDFHARVTAARARVVLVRAHQGNRGIQSSLAASLAEALAALPDAMGVAPSSAAVLVALNPRLADTFEAATADTATGEDALRRRVIALSELLATVSERKRVALLIDDLHWADVESLRILAGLRSTIESGRILAVVTSRLPRDASEALGALETLQLPPLDVAGVAEFVARLGRMPMEGWVTPFLQQLLNATRGIPLELVESLQRLLELGVLRLRDGSWEVDDPERLLQDVSAGDALQRRLAGLSSAERETLLRIATIGRPVEAKSLPRELVDTLEQRGFVWRDAERVGVVHDEIAEAALEAATPELRRMAHAWAAEQFRVNSTSATQPVLAYHAARAEDEALLRRVTEEHVRARRADGDRRPVAQVVDDLVGATVAAAQRQRLATSLPWSLRSPWGWRPAVVIAAVLIVIAGISAWRRPPAPADADLILLLRLASTQDSLTELSLSYSGTGRRIQAAVPRIRPRSAYPPLTHRGLERLVPLPDGTGFIGHGFFGGPNGDEIVEVDERGELRFIAPSTADDGFALPSPDGRFVAFSTARYDTVTDHLSLAVLERATGRTRRVTHSDDIEHLMGWSPDGTRFAYQRVHFSRDREATACVINFDGTDERCDWPALGDRKTRPLGWVDARTLVVSVDDDRKLMHLDVENGEVMLVGASSPQLDVIVGTSMLGESIVDPVSGVGQIRFRWNDSRTDTSVPAASGSAVPLLVQRRSPGPPFLDRIIVSPLSGSLPTDATHQLRVAGVGSDGAAMHAYALRFTSRDTNIVVVSAEGRMMPRRKGRTWVVVAAGGWRSDSVLVDVGAAETSVLLGERWADDWIDRWRGYGDPNPLVREDSGVRTFVANGDGSYESGAYTRQDLPVGTGIGIEALVRLPVTFPQWQTLGVSLIAFTRLNELSSWDHRSGNLRNGASWACAASFPFGEGAPARRAFVVGGLLRGELRVPAPTGLYSGDWKTLRIQYFPDGRCGVAIDGTPLAILDVGTPTAGVPVRLVLNGHSVNSALVVGPLQVWQGVRNDLPWEQVAVSTPTR